MTEKMVTIYYAKGPFPLERFAAWKADHRQWTLSLLDQ
jgi:hypothetical protein